MIVYSNWKANKFYGLHIRQTEKDGVQFAVSEEGQEMCVQMARKDVIEIIHTLISMITEEK